MKKRLLLAGISCFLTPFVYAQGVIVNEISQGPAGAQEFIELLVVGSAAQTTGTVDLRDWIIDDNNGAFQLSDNSAPGIAIGHFRFAPNDTLSAVPIGALIVIYNVSDPNPAWTFRQFNAGGQDIAHIENGGLTYYIPGTSTLLRACSGTPNNASTSYAYTASTIPPVAANWTGQIGLANNGDAIQLRKPDGTFFHGFGFSTPTIANSFTTFPSFSEVSLPSFNGYTGTSANTVVYFDCGSYYYGSNFLSGAASTETPGQGNNANNTLLISHIRLGLFQYGQLGLNVPCSQILPVTWLYFNGVLKEQQVYLQWATAQEKNNAHFLIQRSEDQKNWYTIGTQPGSLQSNDKKEYRFTDQAPLPGTSFYRLAQQDLDGKLAYTSIVTIDNNKNTVTLYPNPVTGDVCRIRMTEQPERIVLYDLTGRQTTALPVKATGGAIYDLDMSGIANGMYYLKLYFNNSVTTIPLVRN